MCTVKQNMQDIYYDILEENVTVYIHDNMFYLGKSPESILKG